MRSQIVMCLGMVISGALIKLLKCSPVYCAVINKHVETEAGSFLRKLGYKELEGLPFACFASSNQSNFPRSPQDGNKLLYYYAMDMASLYPVLALDPQPHDTVLDLCAAPGGKAFALLQVVRSEVGGAVALNDSNASRVKRLHDVVHRCVPKRLKHSIRITRRKGEEWGQIEQSVFDRVLVDAPCSADRHNILKWATKNKFWPDTEEFMKLQQSLLVSSFHAVKSEGVVVYSTCTMSACENDTVIEGAIEEARNIGCQVKVEVLLNHDLERTLFGSVEETSFGKLLIPSTNLNIGPMYVTKLCVEK